MQKVTLSRRRTGVCESSYAELESDRYVLIPAAVTTRGVDFRCSRSLADIATDLADKRPNCQRMSCETGDSHQSLCIRVPATSAS